MRFRDRQIKKVSDLLRALDTQLADDSLIWFRGQSSASYSLVPGLGRPGSQPNAEMALIKRFKQNAVPHLPIKPSTEWEWLFLMQHHRLKTRLLDWTESPLAGLYFAVESQSNEDGALWCIDPVALNIHANINFDYNLEIPAFDHDEILNNYLPSIIASETTSELPPIAALASRNSPRIAATWSVPPILSISSTPFSSISPSRNRRGFSA